MANIMGADFGYVQTKAIAEEWGCKFPSIVKRRSEVFATDLEDSEGYLITGQNGSWNVGSKGSYDFKTERLTSESDTPKFLTVLGLYNEDTNSNFIDLMVSGLPIDDFKVVSYKNEFTQRLQGGFRFGFGSKDKFVRVAKAVVIPQSAGAFYDYVLDDNGDTNSESIDLAAEDVLVLDIGGKSTDGCIMESARFSQDSFTIWQGAWAAQNELRKLIMNKHRYNVPPYKMADVMTDSTVRIGAKDVAIPEMVKTAVETVFPALRDELSLYVPDFRRFSAILMAGGGAYPFHDYIADLARIPVMVLPNAEFANANGDRKYGLLKWKEGRL